VGVTLFTNHVRGKRHARAFLSEQAALQITESKYLRLHSRRHHSKRATRRARTRSRPAVRSGGWNVCNRGRGDAAAYKKRQRV